MTERNANMEKNNLMIFENAQFGRMRTLNIDGSPWFVSTDVCADRHRDGRAFCRAGKRNDPLFMTKDFYKPNAEKSEYTLVTTAGKDHFRGLVDDIAAWVPSEKNPIVTNGETETENAVYAQKEARI